MKEVRESDLTSWNCPHCGYFYDTTKGVAGEVFTVGVFRPSIPHMTCPKCRECMGCRELKNPPAQDSRS